MPQYISEYDEIDKQLSNAVAAHLRSLPVLVDEGLADLVVSSAEGIMGTMRDCTLAICRALLYKEPDDCRPKEPYGPYWCPFHTTTHQTSMACSLESMTQEERNRAVDEWKKREGVAELFA